MTLSLAATDHDELCHSRSWEIEDEDVQLVTVQTASLVSHLSVGQIIAELAWPANLQDFGAKIAHRDTAGDRVGAVNCLIA
jgi:hypothetical protein